MARLSYINSMKTITPRAINAHSFAPYGQLLDAPKTPGREDFQARLFNGRADAKPNLLLARANAQSLPLDIKVMERHPQSSQTFVPLDATSYLVLVCPDAAGGGPDMLNLQAFIVGSAQGINYKPGTWHHPLTVLERAGCFAALVWENGGEADTEWHQLTTDQLVRVEA